MAILSDYTTGTVTIAANSTAVTGIGTAWNLTALQAGDELLINNLVAIIASVNSATSITITRPWTGGAVTSVAYRARYQPDGSRFSNIAKELLELLNNSPNFDAFAALVGANGLVPYFTGAGTMSTIASGTKGRDLLTSTTTLNMLGKFGPVNGGVPSVVPSAADVGLADGDFNTITVPGTYSITGTWANGPSSSAGLLHVWGRGTQVFQEFWVATATNMVRYYRYTANPTSWPNAWIDTTPLNVPSSVEINDANLPSRIRAISKTLSDTDDLNNLISETGFFNWGSPVPINGPTGATFCGMINLRRNSSTGLQVAIPFNANPIRWRFHSAGAWSQWYVLGRSAVGTVSQSGGLPTGDIIERGSNSNGEYVRFADGTQVCWKMTVASQASDQAIGSLFRAATASTWTYPVSFAATPFVTATSHNITNNWPIANAFAANAQVRLFGNVSSSTLVDIDIYATGRWF